MNTVNKKGKKLTVLKWGIIAALTFCAAYIALWVPAAADSVMPVSYVTRAENYIYSPCVAAKGNLAKTPSGWTALVYVNEGDISSVAVGQQAALTGAAFPDGSFFGKVSAIGDSAHVITQSTVSLPETVVDVTIEVEQGDTSILRTGYSVTAQIKTGEERTVSVLPYSVIGQDDEGEYVYVLEKGLARRRGIVTGIELSDGTEIVSGISREDNVLAEPEKLFEGARVRTGGKSKE